MNDYILRGTGANNTIRILLANTKNTVETARTLHQTSPVATAALGRLLTAGAIMGAMLKGEKDLLTLQIKGNGPIGSVIVTSDSKARVKGYVQNPNVDLPLNDKGKLDVANGLGIGVLNVIKDIGLKDPYIGQTHLVTSEIAEDLTYYFANSEQTPSSVALGVLVDRDYSVKQSGGYIIQAMPGAVDKDLETLEKNLRELPPITTMLEDNLNLEDIARKAFKDLDLQIHEEVEPKFYCNCSIERVEKALISVGRKDIQEMINENKDIEMNCHFCSKNYKLTISDLERLLSDI